MGKTPSNLEGDFSMCDYCDCRRIPVIAARRAGHHVTADGADEVEQ